MAEGCVKLDLEGTLAMTRRFSHAIDTVWCRALRSGAPADTVMALDEASLGLHRARIALADLDEATRTAGRPPEVARGDQPKVAPRGPRASTATPGIRTPRRDPT
jgi:hypothetical protein